MTQVKGPGRAVFAAVLLMIGGVLNTIYGIAAISNSHFYVHNTHYVFANLKTWGWITLALGVLELLASVSLFGGGGFGRWIGIIAAGLVAIDSLLQIPAYPFLSIAIFALSLWIIHGLTRADTESFVDEGATTRVGTSAGTAAGPRTPA